MLLVHPASSQKEDEFSLAGCLHSQSTYLVVQLPSVHHFWTLTFGHLRIQNYWTITNPFSYSQETAEAGIRDLFKAYDIHFITKLFAPREEKRGEEGNHYYCFVELKDERQTDDAIKELDWMEMWSWKVRVKLATKSGTTKREANRTWAGSRAF